MRRSLLAAAVLTAVLPIAACSGETTGTGTSSGTAGTTSAAAAPMNDEVAWVDKVCGEIVSLADAQTSAPPDLAGAEPAQALQEFDVYITKNIDVVDQAVAGLKEVGKSPFQGGDEALAALVTGLEALKAGYENTKQQFAAVDVNDPATAQSAMLEAFSGLATSGEEFGKALEGVENNPALEEAAKQAPNCQKMDEAGSEPTPTS